MELDLIVYEYVNENENHYAVMQIKPEPALRAPGLTAVCGEAAAVCGETRPTLFNSRHASTEPRGPRLSKRAQTRMSVLQSEAHEDIRPPALFTGPARREIVHVHSGAVHVFRTRE